LVRFQKCNFIVKAWRYRFYVYAFIKTIKYWLIFNSSGTLSCPVKFGFIWGINKSQAQIKMNWIYSTKEVIDRLNN